MSLYDSYILPRILFYSGEPYLTTGLRASSRFFWNAVARPKKTTPADMLVDACQRTDYRLLELARQFGAVVRIEHIAIAARGGSPEMCERLRQFCVGRMSNGSLHSARAHDVGKMSDDSFRYACLYGACVRGDVPVLKSFLKDPETMKMFMDGLYIQQVQDLAVPNSMLCPFTTVMANAGSLDLFKYVDCRNFSYADVIVPSCQRGHANLMEWLAAQPGVALDNIQFRSGSVSVADFLLNYNGFANDTRPDWFLIHDALCKGNTKLAEFYYNKMNKPPVENYLDETADVLFHVGSRDFPMDCSKSVHFMIDLGVQFTFRHIMHAIRERFECADYLLDKIKPTNSAFLKELVWSSFVHLYAYGVEYAVEHGYDYGADVTFDTNLALCYESLKNKAANVYLLGDENKLNLAAGIFWRNEDGQICSGEHYIKAFEPTYEYIVKNRDGFKKLMSK